MNETEKYDIEVDYDNISVPAIMEQIKRKTAEEARLESQPLPGAAGQELAAPEVDFADEPALPARGGRVRRILLKVMTPFRPLIKLLIWCIKNNIHVFFACYPTEQIGQHRQYYGFGFEETWKGHRVGVQ